MKVTVFGASGKVGRLVVAELLAQGHTVTAFIHTASPFDESIKQLRIVRGDVHNAKDVSQAIAGSEAVVSTLGSWGTKTKDIVSSATSNIVPAMEKQNIRRIVSLTGSGAHAPGDHVTIGDRISHAVFGVVAGKIIKDGEQHLTALDKSSLDWTVVRAPVMKNGPVDSYILNSRLPGPLERVSRNTIATAIVDQLSDVHFSRAAPHIHTGK